MSTNFIYKKKKALSKFYCNELINYFEESKSKWESGCVYDEGVKTSRAHKNSIDLPMTVLGGAGSLDDFKALFSRYGIIGAAAGSIFVFKGRYRAVLIQYPSPEQKDSLTNYL